MCMHLWFLCGWQGILWHLDICIGMLRLPLIVAYMFSIYHPSSVSSLTIQLCLGSNRIFQFTPCAPHHNHPNYFHPTMGAHSLCLIIHYMPQLPIWAKRFWAPFSIHGASLAFFFNKIFKNLAHHEFFSHKLATFVVQYTLSFCW